MDKHGLDIKGIRKACGETKDYGDFSGKYVEIFYDAKSGEVWTRFQYSLGRNSWTEYRDPNIIKVCNTSRYMKMQEICDKILMRVVEYAQINGESAGNHNVRH